MLPKSNELSQRVTHLLIIFLYGFDHPTWIINFSFLIKMNVCKLFNTHTQTHTHTHTQTLTQLHFYMSIKYNLCNNIFTLQKSMFTDNLPFKPIFST